VRKMSGGKPEPNQFITEVEEQIPHKGSYDQGKSAIDAQDGVMERNWEEEDLIANSLKTKKRQKQRQIKK
jgi:hypothetical protein